LKNFGSKTSSNQAANGTGDIVQFGDSSFKQVVDLANQASLSDYMRDILTARRSLIEKKAALQTKLSRSAGNLIANYDEDFIVEASRSFANLKNEYVSLLNSVRKIRQQAYGDFYRPLGSPAVVGSLFPPNSKLVLALALMLGGLLAFMLALVLPGRRH
jgi:hypothetical protein